MTHWESLLQSNNGSSIIKQLALIAFFILEYIYIYIYIYIFIIYIYIIYIYTYLSLSIYLSIYPSIYLYMHNHENHVPSRFITTYLFGNSCTWAHDVRLWVQMVHHVPKCMNCHKAIVLITGRAHCFHDYIYIMPILLL